MLPGPVRDFLAKRGADIAALQALDFDA